MDISDFFKVKKEKVYQILDDISKEMNKEDISITIKSLLSDIKVIILNAYISIDEMNNQETPDSSIPKYKELTSRSKETHKQILKILLDEAGSDIYNIGLEGWELQLLEQIKKENTK
jgi:hypothetical protein